eukprot:CAMPEP_0185176476 /NCGR_PEP_ID=MMETSP1139-20130426/28385_1 /TAXON_ID=298111 /ORGANISM="Pavlova sp., Strain CCMP459" /LENGTH=63 /DNA_ID=CAMNT_0027742243 /DNA_START=19 /DNA_END=207 /DNA_ORIENTATION=-
MTEIIAARYASSTSKHSAGERMCCFNHVIVIDLDVRALAHLPLPAPVAMWARGRGRQGAADQD